jgi:pimeloyl-ACP methyl ester carboxylesterase
MAHEKTRIGPVLTQEDGLKTRDIFLRIDPRIELYIKEKWQDGHDAKLPVVLLHGAGMDGAGWDVPVEGASLLDVLARNGSRAYAFDFRGHGRSSRVVDGKTVSREPLIVDTLAVLDYVKEASGQSQVVLIGESLGSIVGSAVAERAPERVAGVALLGFIYRGSGADLEDMLAAMLKEPAGYAYTTEEEWPELFIPSASPAVTAWHQAHFGTAYMYPVGPYVAVSELPAAKTPERISGRVLVVTGDLDPFATQSDTQAFLSDAGARHKRHLYQQGVGHLPYVERGLAEVQAALCELVDAASGDAGLGS